MRNLSGYLLILGCLVMGGCPSPQYQREEQLQEDLADCRDATSSLQDQVQRLGDQLRDRRKQVETLHALGGKRMENLFTVESIELGGRTGGIDTDDEPGQDAIKVFLLPKDAAGHTIKAAGEATLQLFDLAGASGEERLSETTIPVEKIGDYWSSGFLSYHYSFELPLPQNLLSRTVTLRVEFTDYLTGRSFSAQKAIPLRRPAPDGE